MEDSTYEEIYNIFSNIRESDIELLGFSDASVHPVNLILQKLIVVNEKIPTIYIKIY